jgi:hypothetical protein
MMALTLKYLSSNLANLLLTGTGAHRREKRVEFAAIPVTSPDATDI